MLVFRIEAANGTGPYQTSCHSSKVNDLTNNMRVSHSDLDHPLPYEDGLGNIDENEYCGFVSVEQMAEWFGGWEFMLESAGFSVVVYEVPCTSVRLGRAQVLFFKADAQVVERSLPTAVLTDV